MLSSLDLDDKTYEDLIAEAVSQISLYSSEWTNFNVSDPGITVLQNFSAFHLLQQNYINEVSDAVRRRLLKLLHYESLENRAARVLLEGRMESEFTLPPQTKLAVGSLIFETERRVTVRPWRIAAVYSEAGGALRDLSYLLDRSVQNGAEIFSAQPQAGMALYCVLSGKPEVGQPVSLCVRVQDSERRNPFRREDNIRFGEGVWQYYTADGWTDCRAEDETCCFLVSGRVKLTLDRSPEVFEETPLPGYALRFVLTRAEYDLPPLLHSITANLFEAVQKDTRAHSLVFDGGGRIELRTGMTAYGYYAVYCREAAGGPYRLYREDTGRAGRGRYYRSTVLEDGALLLEFDPEQYGNGPEAGEGSVRVVCYDEETIHHRRLGPVYGYENQLIDIDLTTNLLADEFCVIAQTVDAHGEEEYEFVCPGETDEDRLCYEVLAEPGQLLVRSPGLGRDCSLILADCAVTAGSGGNLRAGNRFVPLLAAGEERPVLENPMAGRGGQSCESAEQLRLRFVRDTKTVTTAVLPSDYEALVGQTPGLCIHKVKAILDEEKNLVKIAVKPYTHDRLPKLSPLYAARIREHLEPFRMITTGIELLQPRYVPVDVRATVNVKSYYQDARREIEGLLRQELDYVSSGRGFGETVVFHELFRRLEQLPCVDSVYSLVLLPQSRGDVTMVGADIRLGSQCLCYPGRVELELNSRSRM